MTLVQQWRKTGVEIDFVELSETPTISGWWDLLRTRTN